MHRKEAQIPADFDGLPSDWDIIQAEQRVKTALTSKMIDSQLEGKVTGKKLKSKSKTKKENVSK